MNFDFDTPVDRRDTHSVKYDGRLTKFGTDDLLPLWVADMDFAAPPCITQALRTRVEHPVYGYTRIPDSLADSFLAWIAARYGWNVPREWILLVPGVVPALYAAVQAFTAPGEAVVVQPPVYPPFFGAVTENGRVVAPNPLRLKGDRYTIDMDDLESRLGEGARLLLLCSPHNPVGRVWSRDELSDIARMAQRYGCTVFSDEIHADLTAGGVCHTPYGSLAGGGISAFAPSKTFNIPGLALSALIIPDESQRLAMRRVFDRLHVASNFNPLTLAAFEAAYRGGATWLEALTAYLDGTRDEAIAFFASRTPRIRPIRPEGTYLMWLDCRATGLDDRALRDFFTRDAKVGLNAGIEFGPQGSGFMRLNLAAPRGTIHTALTRIADAYGQRFER